MGAVPLLTACAERFFFYPDRHTYTPHGKLKTRTENVFFDSEGARLHGWWMPAVGPSLALVVHLHGNAANVSNHIGQVAWLPAHGFEVLTFDYRGFGYSEGSPSLEGVVKDARWAIAKARQIAPHAPLVLLGQSLGGATAIRAATLEQAHKGHNLRLLVLDSPFASYRDMVRDATRKTVLSLISPMAEAGLPQRDKDPVKAIARLQMPLLLLHGESDRVVPISHSERLHAAAIATQRKELLRIPQGRHLDAMQREDIRAHVLDHLRSAVQ